VTSQISEAWFLKFLLAHVTSQHSSITRIMRRRFAALFDTDLESLNFTRLAIQVVTSDEYLKILVFNCLHRTAQYRHIPRFRLVQFRFL
jgi:hypothetical protein